MSIRISSEQAISLPPVEMPDLCAYFHNAAVPREKWRVGAEFEKLAVLRATGEQVPYEGPHGIREILSGLSRQYHWVPHYEGSNLVALQRDQTVISFEPGGQIELASPPVRNLWDIKTCLEGHRNELRDVVDPEEIAWLAVGVTPFSRVEDIRLVPRERYHIMARYLDSRAAYGHHMMRGTASTQASFDYENEEAAVERFLLAISISPLVSAIFANSPLYAGALTGDVSFRGRIWHGMDPDRAGLLADVVRPGEFSFERWVTHLLDVPMMFYCVHDVFMPAEGRTFREFMARGLDGYFPTIHDWEMHLTSIFPEVRLKKYLEVRGADATSPELSLGFVALWKGLLYDDSSCKDAMTLAGEIRPEERDVAFQEYYTRGLEGRFKGRSLLDWCHEIVELASAGLKRQSEENAYDDERPLLDPVLRVIDRGRSPGREWLERWQSIAPSPPQVADLLQY